MSCLIFFYKHIAGRRKLEEKYKVRMQQLDYLFYEDQKEPRIGKCLDTLEEFEHADIEFLTKFHA